MLTFGRLVNKWRIFKRPLQVKLKNVGNVFICATRLHYFCINEGRSDNVLINDASQNIPSTLLVIPAQENPSTIPSNSNMRDIVVEEISTMGPSRLAYNLKQKKIWF